MTLHAWASKSNTSTEATDEVRSNSLIGFFAVVAACCSSGLAGVYFELVLKGSKTSLWVRNVQLSLVSMVFGMVSMAWCGDALQFVLIGWIGPCTPQTIRQGPVLKDQEVVAKFGFFYGYNYVVWAVVLLQAVSL